jgi:hypothetical protein
MAASKTPGYSYCTRCGRGSIPTSDEACDCGFEAALERPRPAPPEDCSPEYVGAIIDATKETIAECVCAQDHPLLSGRFVGALLKRGLRIYPLRSAGTGAAPPEWRQHFCPKCDADLRVWFAVERTALAGAGVNWQGVVESLRLQGTELLSCVPVTKSYAPNADSWAVEQRSGLMMQHVATMIEAWLVRGGAAQPPPREP